MIDYLIKAMLTWLVGFAPQFEVYLAVPAGKAMGLDYASATFWAIFGNFMAVPVVLIFFHQIRGISWLNRFIDQRYSEKHQQRLARYGPWFVVVATPLVGAWIVAVMARIAGMGAMLLLISSFASIVLYGVLTAVVVATGLELFWN